MTTKAPKLAEIFPSLAVHARRQIPRTLPGIDGDPFDLPFHAMLFLQELLLAAESTQKDMQSHSGLAALERISLTILEEVKTARSFEASEEPFLKWVRLSVATFVANAAFETGDIGRTHEWLMRALVEDYRNGEENLTETDTLCGALAAPQKFVGSLVTDAVLKWLETLFSHGFRSGDLRDLADQMFDVAEKMVAEGVVRLASFPGLAARMMLARAEWSTRYRQSDSASATAHVIAALNSGNLSPEDTAAIDVFLPADATLAVFLLASHRKVLTPDQRFKLRLRAANGEAVKLRQMHGQLLADIKDLRLIRERSAKTPTEAMLRAGRI